MAAEPPPALCQFESSHCWTVGDRSSRVTREVCKPIAFARLDEAPTSSKEVEVKLEGIHHITAITEKHPEVPAELALQGFHAARAYSHAPDTSSSLLEGALGFTPYEDSGFAPTGFGWEARGDSRGGLWTYDTPPDEPGIQGAGTV